MKSLLLLLQGAFSWSLWSYVKDAEYERLGLPTTPSPRKDTTTMVPCIGGEEQQYCELQCFNQFKDCKKDCLDDSSCTNKCVKKYTDCEVECPCHTNCPTGCPCPGWQCPCEIRGENHLEHEKCKSVADEHQAKCLKGCHVGDSRCIQLCTVGYTNELNNCPCGKNCPDGCPCDIWECEGDWWETTPGPPTTPEPITWDEDGWFLVLNSFKAPQVTSFRWAQVDRQPVMDEMEGFNLKYPEPGAVDYVPVDIEATCSMVVNNTLYIIGGPPFNGAQFIQVDGCTLKSMGVLNYPHDGGLCMVYYLGIEEKPIACSAESSEGKMCYGFNPKSSSLIMNHYTYKTPAMYNHFQGAMVEYMGSPLLIGGRTTTQVEHMYYFNETTPYEWVTMSPFPCNGYIAYHSAVNFLNTVYVFGGRGGRGYHSDEVYTFTGTWVKYIKKLGGSRYGHRSFTAGNAIFHVGGHYGDTASKFAPIEKWSWSAETVHFESGTSFNRLEDYMQYPEIFPLDPPYTCDPLTGVPIPK